MKKTNILFLPLFLLFSLVGLSADDTLMKILQEKRWGELPTLFSDNSYSIIQSKFSEAQDLRLTTISKNEILYKVKFSNYAEIGFIIFQKERDLYSTLSIENQIKPIYFISGFRKYSLDKEYTFRLGDGEFVLRKGVIYEALPRYHTGFLFFTGDWQCKITPADPEERLTLLRYQKSETFIKDNVNGIFVIQDRKFLESQTLLAETGTVDAAELNAFVAFFKDYFGFIVADFNEYWYLSVQERENVLIFEKDKKSFYFYDFNEDSVPDTQLRTTGDNRLLLNYNAVTVPKMTMSQPDEMRKVNLNLFYNPDKNFLSGTATLYFKNKLTFRSLNLYDHLLIHQAITADYKNINLFKKGGTYFISSPETDTLSFFFKGTIQKDESIPDLVRVIIDNNMEKLVDEFYFLSRNLNFYPNSGSGFFRSNLKISIPEKYSCLASGKEVSASNSSNRNQYHFNSEKTKGLALICGDFSKKATIDSRIPINVYSANDFRYKRHFPHEDIKECADFLTNLYGGAATPSLNLLLRRWRDDGGISNTGFIIINILESNIGLTDISLPQRIYQRDSPVVFMFNKKEYLLHELAHQWWGSLVSWSNYRDEWITEGLAHFSTLLYLKETISENKFMNLTDRMFKWVLKYRDAGPIIYGKRIANLDQYEAFQGIVYVKAALVMLMLRDILGHDELINRLRSLLSIFKFKNVSSREFINCISQGNPVVHRFMTQWIYSRKLPEATYSIQVNNDEVDVFINQNDTDYVFPVWVEMATEKGRSVNMEIIDQKTQHIRLKAESPVRSIRVDSRYSPILLKKEGGAG